MDFTDQLKSFSDRAKKIKDRIETEEATKTSLILPFFQLLGYDVFNPHEFVPEFTAEAGIKKGEKVDYAIMIEDKPTILIEAKWVGENLDNHDSQLFRYFVATPSKFAILTNGTVYRFYTDLDEPNKMDKVPFLEIDILNIKDSTANELMKFHKSHFSIEAIFDAASELKYSNLIKQLFTKQFASPTDPFITYILSEIYEGRKTQNVLDRFRNIVKTSLNQYINDLVDERIKKALSVKEPEESLPPTPEVLQPQKKEKVIITTIEELEAYATIKILLSDVVDPEKITYKDTESYLAILVENNSWKWICRLWLGEGQKVLYIPDENKNQVKFNISGVNDLIQYKNQLIDVVKRYI